MSWALLIFDSSRRKEAALFDRQLILFATTNTQTLRFIAYASTEAGLGG
jgi:hypothetical protein